MKTISLLPVLILLPLSAYSRVRFRGSASSWENLFLILLVILGAIVAAYLLRFIYETSIILLKGYTDPDTIRIDKKICAPSLGRINGCGFGLIGFRNPENRYGTYVTNYVFTLLFIPAFFISSYRVLRSGDKYLFLAKEPLPAMLKVYTFISFVGAAFIFNTYS